MEWLKSRGMRGRRDDAQWWDKQRIFDEDGEVRDEYLHLFRNEARIRPVEYFLRFKASSFDSDGDAEGPFSWLAVVYV